MITPLPRSLTRRTIALLLVPCLALSSVEGLAVPISFASPAPTVAANSSLQQRFEEEALAAAAVAATLYIIASPHQCAGIQRLAAAHAHSAGVYGGALILSTFDTRRVVRRVRQWIGQRQASEAPTEFDREKQALEKAIAFHTHHYGRAPDRDAIESYKKLVERRSASIGPNVDVRHIGSGAMLMSVVDDALGARHVTTTHLDSEQNLRQISDTLKEILGGLRPTDELSITDDQIVLSNGTTLSVNNLVATVAEEIGFTLTEISPSDIRLPGLNVPVHFYHVKRKSSSSYLKRLRNIGRALWKDLQKTPVLSPEEKRSLIEQALEKINTPNDDPEFYATITPILDLHGPGADLGAGPNRGPARGLQKAGVYPVTMVDTQYIIPTRTSKDPSLTIGDARINLPFEPDSLGVAVSNRSIGFILRYARAEARKKLGHEGPDLQRYMENTLAQIFVETHSALKPGGKYLIRTSQDESTEDISLLHQALAGRTLEEVPAWCGYTDIEVYRAPHKDRVLYVAKKPGTLQEGLKDRLSRFWWRLRSSNPPGSVDIGGFLRPVIEGLRRLRARFQRQVPMETAQEPPEGELSEELSRPSQVEPFNPYEWRQILLDWRMEFQERRGEIWKSKKPFKVKMERTTALADEFVQRIYAQAARWFPEEAKHITLVRTYGYDQGEPEEAEGQIIFTPSNESMPQAAELINSACNDVLDERWEYLPVKLLEAQPPDQEIEVAAQLPGARYVAGNHAIGGAWMQAIQKQLNEPGARGDSAWAQILSWNKHFRIKGGLGDLYAREPDVMNGVGAARNMDAMRRLVQAHGGESRDPLGYLTKYKFLKSTERRTAENAYESLMNVQSALNEAYDYQSQSTKLEFMIQGEVAQRLGYTHWWRSGRRAIKAVEAMLHDYYASSEALFRVTSKVMRRVAKNIEPPVDTDYVETPLRGIAVVKRYGRVYQVDKGLREVEEKDAEPTLVPAQRDLPFRLKSEEIMPLFQHAAEEGCVLCGRLLDALEDSLPDFSHRIKTDRHFAEKTQAQFLELLQTRRDISYVIWRLHYLGYLPVLLPAFGELKSKVVADIEHPYTLDVSALKTLELGEHFLFNDPSSEWTGVNGHAREAANHFRQPSRLRTLRLGLLLQTLDETAPRAARAALRQLAVPTHEAKQVAWLYNPCHRGWLHKNWDSPIEIMRARAFLEEGMLDWFIQTVPERDYDRWTLMLFSTLIHLRSGPPERFQLYLRDLLPLFELKAERLQNHEALKRWADAAREKRHEVMRRRFEELLPPSEEERVAVDIRAPDDLPEAMDVTVAVPEDEPGVLAKIAGVLTAQEWEILTAQLDDAGGNTATTYDNFIVKGPHGEWPPSPEKLRMFQEANRKLLVRDLTAVLREGVSVEEIFKRHHRPYVFRKRKTAFQIDTAIKFEQLGNRRTYLRIETADRPGVLHVIAERLLQYGINIQPASTIDTEGYDSNVGLRVVDVFAVDLHGKALSGKMRRVLEKDLKEMLNRDVIDGARVHAAVHLPKSGRGFDTFFSPGIPFAFFFLPLTTASNWLDLGRLGMHASPVAWGGALAALGMASTVFAAFAAARLLFRTIQRTTIRRLPRLLHSAA